MKAIIQAYSPEEIEKIARGEQTVKVCKTAPKDTPFKVYMYCIKDGMDVYGNAKRYVIDTLHILNENAAKAFEETTGLLKWNGKVVGEYVCDKVIKYDYQTITCAKYEVNGADVKEQLRYNAGACLNSEEMYSLSNGKDLRGLHIPAVKFYDKPKELGEFRKPCPYGVSKCMYDDRPKCYDCDRTITHPPRGWQYVEALDK